MLQDKIQVFMPNTSTDDAVNEAYTEATKYLSNLSALKLYPEVRFFASGIASQCRFELTCGYFEVLSHQCGCVVGQS